MANEDKSARYHRLHRRASVLSAGAAVLYLLALLVTDASAALRDGISAITAGAFIPTLAGYVVVVAVLHELLQLPLAFYRGVTLERRYGLSTQPTGRWWLDYAKSAGIALVFAIVAAIIVCSFLRWRPDQWWIWAAACFAVLLVVLAQLAPVILLPLFYELKPLAREALVRRLVALVERSGTRILGVFEWRLSDRTRKANAALTGLGYTRRILLSDTLLTEHSDDEIEVILAHELAHHVHRDIWSSIALEAALMVAAFYATDRVLSVFAFSFGLAGKGDIAVLPLLALTGGAMSCVLRPIANAFSRAHERRADRYALEMTRNVPAFISAMKRLGAQNLAEERPSRLVEIVFYTHPPLAARIEAARAYERTCLISAER